MKYKAVSIQYLAKLLKEKRLKENMDLNTLARELEISAATLSRIENEVTLTPNHSTMTIICNWLGLRPAVLTTEIPTVVASPRFDTSVKLPRRFELYRKEDPHGVSGTGVVGVGVIWPSGKVSLEWTSPGYNHAGYDSLVWLQYWHCQEGRTVVNLLDGDE